MPLITTAWAKDIGGWLRVGNYGLAVWLNSRYPKYFSERNGYRKVHRGFGLAVEILRKEKSCP